MTRKPYSPEKRGNYRSPRGRGASSSGTPGTTRTEYHEHEAVVDDGQSTSTPTVTNGDISSHDLRSMSPVRLSADSNVSTAQNSPNITMADSNNGDITMQASGTAPTEPVTPKTIDVTSTDAQGQTTPTDKQDSDKLPASNAAQAIQGSAGAEIVTSPGRCVSAEGLPPPSSTASSHPAPLTNGAEAAPIAAGQTTLPTSGSSSRQRPVVSNPLHAKVPLVYAGPRTPIVENPPRWHR